jgi:cytidine deaminase
LSGSEKPEKLTWPTVEQRHAARRSKARRAEDAAAPPTTERRMAERRATTERRDESAWEVLPLEGASPTEAADTLIAAALQARRFAHARYSHFDVGAALETASGEVVTGCNIENATYGLTLCAERVALVKALSEGHGVFTRIAVVADTGDLTPPCGPCRQLLWEYCGDIEIVLANLVGATARYRLSALFPMPFDARLLE